MLTQNPSTLLKFTTVGYLNLVGSNNRYMFMLLDGIDIYAICDDISLAEYLSKTSNRSITIERLPVEEIKREIESRITKYQSYFNRSKTTVKLKRSLKYLG